MLRTPMNLNYMKRTIRPLYANTQATPKACLLDSSMLPPPVDIYPGMVMMRIGQGGTGGTPRDGNLVSLFAAGGNAYGLADFFEAPALGIRQISDSGVNACAVWVLGPDSEFVVNAPAFDATDPNFGNAALNAVTTGATVPLYGITSGAKQGQLTTVKGSGLAAVPICKLLSVNFIKPVPSGADVLGSITIAGLSQSDHSNAILTTF